MRVASRFESTCLDRPALLAPCVLLDVEDALHGEPVVEIVTGLFPTPLHRKVGELRDSAPPRRAPRVCRGGRSGVRAGRGRERSSPWNRVPSATVDAVEREVAFRRNGLPRASWSGELALFAYPAIRPQGTGLACLAWQWLGPRVSASVFNPLRREARTGRRLPQKRIPRRRCRHACRRIFAPWPARVRDPVADRRLRARAP